MDKINVKILHAHGIIFFIVNCRNQLLILLVKEKGHNLGELS